MSKLTTNEKFVILKLLRKHKEVFDGTKGN